MDSKILIAEDEAKIRQLVASYLVREGFKVIEAADGEQAIEKFENNEDVVLVMLDVMMPTAMTPAGRFGAGRTCRSSC